jgi:enoyl-CoA hydratase/carnithine racemase
MYQHLKVSHELDGRIWLLEFDHGKANEIGAEQLRELEQLTAELVADGSVIALISFSRRVSSKGKPIFVAGANVTERAGWSDDQVKGHVSWQRETLRALRAAPVFHVVVAHGVALGWGTEFLLTADYRIATQNAEFALPETSLGILPGAGGTSDLWKVVGPGHALRLGMTGERILANEAARIGLIEEVVPDLEAGFERARQLAGLVARRSPTAVAAFKAGVLAAMSGEDGPSAEARAYAWCVDSGEAAIGRANFAAITSGGGAPWGPRRLFRP